MSARISADDRGRAAEAGALGFLGASALGTLGIYRYHFAVVVWR